MTLDEAAPGVISAAALGPGGRTFDVQSRDFLATLSRAVQRASIYPVGHPSVSTGIGPVVGALQPLLTQGTLTIAVGRTRIIVSAGAHPPTEHQSPWLATRLFERGISGLALDADVDAEEATRLVDWVAHGATGPDDDFPEISGVHLTRFDVRLLRFRDKTATEAPATEEATATWRALVSALLPPGEQLSEDDAPYAVASQIRWAVATSEGTGVADLADRLVSVRHHLERIAPEAREAVCRKLASLVNELRPELRSTLLSVRSDDAADKMSLLLHLVEHFPMSVIREVVGGLDLDSAPMSPGFSRFFEKLVQVAADDPALTAVVGGDGSGFGLTPAATDEERPVLLHSTDATPVTSGAKPDYVPDSYRSRLEELGASRSAVASAEIRGLAESVDRRAVERHVARIALLEAGRAPDSADAVPYFRWISGFAPRELERGGLPLLAETADLVLRATSGATPDQETAVILTALREVFGRQAAVNLALKSIAEQPTGGAREATVLLAAGGIAAYRHVLAWLRTARSEQSRENVAAALLSLGAEIQQAIAADANADRTLAESLVAVLADIEPAPAINIAMELRSNPSPDIREQATAWLIGTPLTSRKFGRVIGQAVEDDDVRIVNLGLSAAKQRPGPAATEALGTLVARYSSPPLLPVQARAVKLLGNAGSEAVAQLQRLLRARRFDCSAPARQLSMTIAATLSRLGTPDSRSTARGWRLSPAGLLAWSLRTREVA